MKILLLVFCLVFLGLGDTCGGNCPSGCPSCPCGSNKVVVDITTWCSKHNWNVQCCKCIVSHESNGYAYATHHNSNGSYDVGLWQINAVNWPHCNSGNAPCDPNQNLNCAISLYKASGNTWKPWSTTAQSCGC